MARLAGGWASRLGGDVVAVDGKALRRSFEDAAARSPLHLVQAFSTHAKLVPGRVEVDGKSNGIPALPRLPVHNGVELHSTRLRGSNGIPALPRLLELLDVEGRLVTADAMHAQRDTAATVKAKGGDYVLALKGSQETLHDDVRVTVRSCRYAAS